MHRRDRYKAGVLLAKLFQNTVKISALDRGSNRIAGDMILKSHLADGGKSCGPDPDNFCFFGNAGAEIIDHAYTAKLAFVDDRYAIAQGFSVGKNVRREENGLAFILELLNKLSHFMAAKRIQA